MFRGKLALFVAAFIWGSAFLFQSLSLNVIGVFSFNAIRFLLASFLYLPIVLHNKATLKRKNNIICGLILGFILGSASNVQQLGLMYFDIGKVSFMTALYILIIPILNYFFYKRNIDKQKIFSLLIATLGLYAMYNGQVKLADLLLLSNAFLFSLQIIFGERYVRRSDIMTLCFYQYVAAGITSSLPAILFEKTTLESVRLALIPILYTGFFSTAVAYSLQLYGQATVDTTTSTILMSLEAPLASLLAFIFLKQQLALHEIIGCSLIFISTILCQIKLK